MVLADLDHFKRINDTYGHLAGDAVLKEAALRMKSGVRPYDTVGRYGGEEFLLVVPSSDAGGTNTVAERVRQSLEAAPIRTDAGQVWVTASLGVAISTEAEPIEPEEILRQADEALYRAKSRGRNRVELFERSSIHASTPNEPGR